MEIGLVKFYRQNSISCLILKNKIDKENFIRFTKPKFVFNHEQNCWFIILTIESKVILSESESTGKTQTTVAGVEYRTS